MLRAKLADTLYEYCELEGPEDSSPGELLLYTAHVYLLSRARQDSPAFEGSRRRSVVGDGTWKEVRRRTKGVERGVGLLILHYKMR